MRSCLSCSQTIAGSRYLQRHCVVHLYHSCFKLNPAEELRMFAVPDILYSDRSVRLQSPCTGGVPSILQCVNHQLLERCAGMAQIYRVWERIALCVTPQVGKQLLEVRRSGRLLHLQLLRSLEPRWWSVMKFQSLQRDVVLHAEGSLFICGLPS